MVDLDKLDFPAGAKWLPRPAGASGVDFGCLDGPSYRKATWKRCTRFPAKADPKPVKTGLKPVKTSPKPVNAGPKPVKTGPKPDFNLFALHFRPKPAQNRFQQPAPGPEALLRNIG